MKKLILLLLIYVTCLFALKAQQCTEATNVNGIAGTGHSNGNFGQSFTACKSGRLASVSAVAGNAGVGFNNVIVEIYSGESFVAANKLLTTGQVHVKANRTTTWDLTSHNLNVVEGQKYTARFLWISGTPQLKYGTGTNASIDYYPRGRLIGIGQAHQDMFFTAKIDIITTTLIPLDQAIGISRISDIQIQFSRNMTALTGDINIKDVVAGTSETIPVGDLIIDGGLVTIPNSTVLKANTQYEILIPSGALESTDGLAFNGFGTGDWTFTTNTNTIPEVTSTAGTITNVSPIPYDIEFSEAVTGFDVTDLTVINGTASNFSGSGTTYTVDITPIAEGDVVVQVAEAVTIEGNDAADLTLEYDVTNPTATITSAVSGTTNRTPIELTVQFSEPVTGFISDFIDLTNAQVATFEAISNTEFEVSIDADAEGAITVDVPVLAATDLAGNTNDASAQFAIDYEVDLNDGLVSHYPLNTVKFDVNSKNDDLVDFGGAPANSDDHHGQSAGGFNYSSSMLYEATFDNAPIENGFSISTWIRPTSEMGVISAKRVIYDHATSSTLYYEANALRLDVNGTSNQYVYPVVLPADTWVHLLISVTKNGSAYLYLDNIQIDLGTGPATLTEATTTLSLGASSTGGFLLNGDMDDFRYYGKALNPIEAFQIFNEAEYLLEDSSIELCENESFSAPDGNVFSEAGTYSYIDPSGDSTPDTFVTLTLNTIPIPDVVANADHLIICEGNEVVLTAQGAESYVWDNGVIDGEAFVPTTTATYSVTGTASNGCENTSQIIVQVVARGFDDEVVTTTAPDFCPDGNPFSGTISTGSSAIGVDYYLRNSEDNSVLDGPIAGTGSSLDFNAGTLTETTTFNVFAEKPSTSTNAALEFDGSNDKVATTFVSSATTELTIEAWIYPRSANYDRVISNYNGSGTLGGDIIIDTYDASANNGKGLRLYLGTGTNAQVNYSVPNVLTTNAWNHIAAVFDNGEVTMYVNGEEVGNSTLAATALQPTTAPFHIGEDRGGVNPEFFNGRIDEIRFWNTARTEGDINSNKDVTLTGTEAGLAAYFKFDDNAGTTATELVNGANGTLTNMDAATDWIEGADISSLDYFSCTFQMTQEVTMGDQTAPTIVLQDVTVQLDENGITNLVASDFDNGSTDNCTSIVNLAYSMDQNSFGCDDIGVNQVMVTVMDEAGNESNAAANVTIEPYIIDEIVTIVDAALCPGESGGTTVSTSSSLIGVNYYLRNSADDSILDGPIEGTGSGLDFETGTLNTSTTFNVYGESGGLSRTALDFDGVDDFVNAGSDNRGIAKEITVAAWIKLNTTATNFFMSKYNGVNGVLLYVDANGKAAIDGRDGSGYKTSGVSTTSINDNEWHYVTARVNLNTGVWSIFIDGSLESSNTYAPGASLASNATLTIGSLNNNYFSGSIDELSIWQTALDEATILSNMNNGVIGGEADIIAHYQFDDGSGSQLTDASTFAGHGTMTNMDQETDWVNEGFLGCQFEMTTEVSITVEDYTDPVAIAQDITVQLDSDGNAIIGATNVNNGSSDNCSSPIVLSLDKTTFTCADLGANTVTLTVTDGANNTATTTTTVTVEDVTAPIGLTQDLTLQLDATGNISLTPEEVNNGSSDTCTDENNLILSLDQSEFGCEHLGQNTVTLTVTDESGNSSTETATITIEDITPPTAVAQDIVIQQEADGTVNISAIEVDNGSFDECSSNLTFELSKSTFSCADLGANSVTLTVTDESGNQSTAEATVMVEDAIAPTTFSQNITAQLDVTGNITIDPASVDMGSTDNCSSALAFTLSQSDFDCTHIGENTVSLSVTDESNNTATENVIITIEETGPTVITQDITVELDANGAATITTADIDNASSDDCTAAADLVMTLDVLDFNCENIGTSSQVTLSVTDLHGNVSTESAIVTVVDLVSPTVITRNISIVLDESGNATITADDIDEGSSDNCTASGNLTMSLDITAFDLNDLGENTVTLTVTDASGNSGSEIATVTVSDKEAQTATITGIADKTFGDADFTLSASIDSNLPATFSVINGGLSITETASGEATFTITGAGSSTIQLSNDGDEIYAPLQENITINIAKADQVLTIEQMTNKSVVAQPFSINASVNTNLALDYTVSGPASISEGVITLDGTLGTVAVTVSQAGNDNYNSVSESVSFDVVEQQSQTITFTEIPDLVYGVPAQTISATASSELDVSFSLISGSAVLTGSSLEITGVGSITIEATQVGNDDFLAADAIQQTFTVTKAPLAISANDQSIVFDEAIPELTISYTGFVNAEDETVLTEIPTISTVAMVGNDVGTYDITLSGGLADNYDITLSNGILTIGQAQAEIVITDLEQTEDGSGKSPTVSTAPADLNYTISYNGSTDIPSAVGSYQVIVTIDELNYMGSKEVTFNINAVLGIDDESGIELNIFPNPVSNILNIESKNSLNGKARMFNVRGIEVINTDLLPGKNRIHVSSLPTGLYILIIQDENTAIVKKQTILINQ